MRTCVYICVYLCGCVCVWGTWLGLVGGEGATLEKASIDQVWVQSCVFSMCVCVCLEHLAWLDEREREPLRASSPVWRAPPPIAATPSHCQRWHHHRNNFFISLLPALLSLSPQVCNWNFVQMNLFNLELVICLSCWVLRKFLRYIHDFCNLFGLSRDHLPSLRR